MILIPHRVHRCGAGGSILYHAAGPIPISGRDKFSGWDFFGVFPHLLDKCQEALAHKVSEYHLAIIIILSYCLVEMNEYVYLRF